MKGKRLQDFWHMLWRPATHLSFGLLTLGGFVAGIVFWGGFNTAVELTNSEAFCLSCHEMKAAPFAELQRTIHYSNRSGVRAVCADCHVPHEWTAKMARKMQASKEVWGKIFGTINTPEKYEAKRLEMAQREWQRLKSNDSLECRNCHDFDAMDFTRQRSFAARAHTDALGSGQATCIDCHKGIAHRLPDMSARAGRESTPVAQWREHELPELLLRNLRQQRLQVAVDTGAGAAQ